VTGRSVARIARSQAARLKHTLMQPFNKHRKIFHRGHVDEITQDGALRGWVFDAETLKGRVQIGLYVGDTLLDVSYADQIRRDVAGVHDCEVECGFLITVTDKMLEKVQSHADQAVELRTMGQRVTVIGTVDMSVDLSNPAAHADDTTACAHALASDLDLITQLMDDLPDAQRTGDAAPGPIQRAPLEIHHKMFNTDEVIPEVGLSGHPAYLDYVRYRYRMDEVYKVAPGMDAADRYLYWYITSYRGQEKRRVPLSRGLLDHLNAPLVMGGAQHTLSRVMWWRLNGRPDLMAKLNLNDRDQFIDLLFWWAHQDVRHMNFEDCLVPDRFADLLRGVHPSRRLDAYPLSYFTERYFKDSPRLRFLRPGTAQGRKTLALSMLVSAISSPDLLRYIPRRIISQLLADGADGAPSDLAAFVMQMHAARTDTAGAQDAAAPTAPPALTRHRYAALLRMRDFDLDSYSFLTRDTDGNRFEAAAMPPPNPHARRVDVQLIGPLAKASGLGQATRLSADILRATGLDVRGVDFDLDNPAPEGFSSDTMIEDYGPARINMIHLNAESIPLAFAYQPDVFSGAYNIGYFFWELDKPAFCHYLGMDMLDEIWVSTEYGVQIYKADANGKPVVNVGMCYEDITDITRPEARAFVNRRFQFDDSHYVCLVAFDSFSFVQRKNPVSVLKAFQKAFEGVPEARLVVKTQNRDSVFDSVQVNLWDQVDAIITSDPRIQVINETLSYRDLLQLKAGSDCYITLHKSEGWGFGMIEAMNLGVPVVCTAYSGNMDFCSDDTAWLVDYDEVPLRQEEYIFVRRGSRWAEPKVDHAAQQLRAAFDNPDQRAAKAQAAQDHIKANFSTSAIALRYGARLRDILAKEGSKT